MFFKKKKEAVPEKAELLKKENIILNCTAMAKEDVVRKMGDMLCASGYVDAAYVEGMLKREVSCSTFIGNGIALPHGVEEAKAQVKQSGIAVMVFPEGTDWNGNLAKIVIGVAGVGDDHLDILANVAENLALPEDVEDVVAKGTVASIHAMFTQSR